MNPQSRDIKLIGTGLAILYGSFLAYYGYLFIFGSGEMRSLGVSLFLALLFVGAVAVVRLKEWGRNLLVVGNAAMGIYLLLPYISIADINPLIFILLNVALFLFFSQDSIKSFFSSKPFVSQAGSWRCILLIDDDSTIVKVIRPALISNGYSVLTAESGEEGIKVARTQKPDLILLDVILPGIKGRDVCKKLKEDSITHNIPVVFLTAKDSLDDIEAEKALGAAGHLTKPVHVKTLITTIQRVLGI